MAYGANTNQGIIRDYNEDRVSIILNIVKPAGKVCSTWPKCSFFGVYDGHGGANCADFLRDNLHHLVVGDVSFPANPREAIRRGFRNAEQLFLNMAQKNGVVVDKSGSCATCALVIGIFLGLNLQTICAMLPMSETAEHFSQLAEVI